jgi:hypothetical protein
VEHRYTGVGPGSLVHPSFCEEEHNDGARAMTWHDDGSSAVERSSTDHPHRAHGQHRRTAGGTRTVRVGQLDAAVAGAPVWVIFGPVRDDAGSRAGEVLDRMAALGPRFRVGLQPSPDTTRWTFTDKPSLSAKPTFDISGCTTTQEILDRVVGQPAAAPISVGQVGERLCVCLDHGIGDSHLMTEIAAALSHTEAPNGFVDPLPAPTVDKPVQSAIGDYLKSAPRQVIRQALRLATTAWSSSRVRARAAARGDEAIVKGAKEAKDYVAVFVKSEPHFADELRAWRDATSTRASVSALVMLSIYRALRDAGIPLADDCEVLVDLRRFLPDAAQTLSNFCAVARVHAGADTCSEKFSAKLRDRSESTGTLVKLAGYAALARAFRAFRRNRDQPRRAVDFRLKPRSAVHLSISDISKMPAVAKVAWSRPMDAEAAVLLPPGSSSHLSIAVWVAGNGSIQATATFSAALVDPDTVRTALRGAFTAQNLRAAHGSPGNAVGHAVA